MEEPQHDPLDAPAYRARPSRAAGGLRLEHWFAVALAVGGAAIVLGEKAGGSSPWITIGVPIAAMAGYLAIGRGYLQRGISRSQYADSIYYLGFLFTLVSITAAIADVGPDGDVSQIVNRFGVKLVTTLIGLGVRVYLVNFRPSGEDVDEVVEESLMRAAARMRERLEQVTLDLDALAASLTLTLRGAGQRTAEELSGALAQASSQFRDTLTTLRGATQASVEELRAAAGAAEQAAGGMTGSLGELQAQVADATREIGGASAALAERLRNLQLPDDLFAAELRPALARLVAAFDDPAQRLGEFGAAAGAGTRELTEAARHAGALAEEYGRLEGGVARAAASLDRAPNLDALGAAATNVGQALQRLAETAEESTRRLRDSNARADEVSRATERHLAEVRDHSAALAAEQAALGRLLAELRPALEAARAPRRGGLGRWFRRAG